MNDKTDSIPRISVTPKDDLLPPELRDLEAKTIKIAMESTPTPASVSLASLYTIVEKIGDGGMGVVYLAQDRKLGRYVAIKRLSKKSLASQKLKERFLREAKAIAKLTHIHIVHIYALGEDTEGPYIVMEYVPGYSRRAPDSSPPKPCSLSDRIESEGPFLPDAAFDMILKVAQAIEYAHSVGVVHRDLKPSNILLDKSGEPKIVDFGLARIFTEDERQLTVPGDKMLSLGYGAPEQEEDVAKADERADVYGLGALFFFMLTGKNPRYFREIDIPENLRMTIVKALATDRSKRWQSAGDFINSLLSLRTHTTVELSTAKNSWRCKWCDTFNPVAIRYCGNCGWDGGESCPECGAEMRVGIQYCGNCGVDAREYDMALHLLDYLKIQLEGRNFDKIIQNADKIASFKPAGKNGKRLIDQIAHIQRQAEDMLKRKAFLANSIKNNFAGKDFEKAKQQIVEYHGISGGKEFEDELNRIPGLIRNRDIHRAGEAIARKNLRNAIDLCEGLLRHIDPRDEEVLQLRRTARKRLLEKKFFDTGAIALLALLLYFLSFPVALRSAADGTVTLPAFYTPVRFAHDYTTLRSLVRWYAGWWNHPNTFAGTAGNNLLSTLPGTSEHPQLAEIRKSLSDTLETISRESTGVHEKLFSEYEQNLNNLLRRMQETGNFEGWVAVNDALENFRLNRKFPADDTTSPCNELNDLNNRTKTSLSRNRYEGFKRIVHTVNQHLERLSQLQSKFTREGNIQDAAAVNAEIKAVKSKPEVNTAFSEVSRHEAEKAANNLEKK